MNKKEYINNINLTVKQIEDFPLYKIDEDVKLLKKVFNIAYKNRLFSLPTLQKENQDKLKLKLFTKLTPYSGSLSFLAIQILAANAIMNKNNFSKKDKYFNKKCGIAINHLRANKTIVSAKKFKDGYKLNGVLTWASGYKIFDSLLIGFHYDGKSMKF